MMDGDSSANEELFNRVETLYFFATFLLDLP